MHHPTFGDLLSSKEVAEITGFTLNQLRNFRQRIDSAPFGFVRQGGSAWYRKVEIDAWLSRNGPVPWTYIPTRRAVDGVASSPESGRVLYPDGEQTSVEIWSLGQAEIEQGIGNKLHGKVSLKYFLPKLESNDNLPNLVELVAKIRFDFEFQSMSDLDLWFEDRSASAKTEARVSQKVVREIATVLSHAQGLGYILPAGVNPNLVLSLAERDSSNGLPNYAVPSVTELEVWVCHPDGEVRLEIEGNWQGTQIRDNLDNKHEYVVGLLQRGTSLGSNRAFWN